MPGPSFSCEASSSSAALFLLRRSCADILATPLPYSALIRTSRTRPNDFTFLFCPRPALAAFPSACPTAPPIAYHTASTQMAPSIPPYLPVAESYTPTHPELFRIIFAKGDFASSLITVAVSQPPPAPPPSSPSRSNPISVISPSPKFTLSISHIAPYTDSPTLCDSHSRKETPSA